MILQYILLFYVHESSMYTHTHEGTQPKKKNNKLESFVPNCHPLTSHTKDICSEVVPKLFHPTIIPKDISPPTSHNILIHSC